MICNIKFKAFSSVYIPSACKEIQFGKLPMAYNVELTEKDIEQLTEDNRIEVIVVSGDPKENKQEDKKENGGGNKAKKSNKK